MREPLTGLIDVMDTGQQSLQLVFKSRAAADKSKAAMLQHIGKPEAVGINGLTEAETAAAAFLEADAKGGEAVARGRVAGVKPVLAREETTAGQGIRAS